MDHEFYDWSPRSSRAAFTWPDDARVAVCVVVSLEFLDLQPPEGTFTPPGFLGPMGPSPYPDMRNYTLREYGNRVGVFRVMSALDKHGVTPTAAVDVGVATRYPFLIDECNKRGWEFAGHGHSVNQAITSKMSDAEERDHINSALDAIEHSTGHRPRGWHGPEYCQSDRTLDILAEAGLEYVMDWPNDEQPYWMETAHGKLVSVPIALELDDVYVDWTRRIRVWEWEKMVTGAFDTLYEEGEESGRLLVLNLHPWLIGQPFRMPSLDNVLGHLRSREKVWFATGSQIADWYRRVY